MSEKMLRICFGFGYDVDYVFLCLNDVVGDIALGVLCWARECQGKTGRYVATNGSSVFSVVPNAVFNVSFEFFAQTPFLFADAVASSMSFNSKLIVDLSVTQNNDLN